MPSDPPLARTSAERNARLNDLRRFACFIVAGLAFLFSFSSTPDLPAFRRQLWWQRLMRDILLLGRLGPPTYLTAKLTKVYVPPAYFDAVDVADLLALMTLRMRV